MRLFFALELPDEIRGRLSRLIPPDADRDYRWADPSGMHLTLAFLGQQPADRLEALSAIGTAAAAASRSGSLVLGEAGAFGSRRAPRVLWVGLRGDVDRLSALQSRLSEALAEAGFPLEDRAFSPHITLARRRQTAQGGPPPGWPPTVEPLHFPLRALTLFESQLSPRGATYVSLGTFACAS